MSATASSSSLPPPAPSSAMLPSPETPEKKLYFCVAKLNGSNYYWHAIDDDVEPPHVLDPVTGLPHYLLDPVFESPSDPNSPHYACGFAAWKSWIFIFGGCNVHGLDSDLNWGGAIDRPVTNVFCIDTLNPEKGWSRGPSLNIPRLHPYGVVFPNNDGGEIWALGGGRDLPIYGESLQPFSGKGWSPMDMGLDGATDVRDDPYHAPTPITIAGHAILSNKLFVYGSPIGGLRCYDAGARKWTLIADDFGAWRNACASIGEMMYLVEGGTFMGYNLIKRECYMGFGLEEDEHLPFTIEDNHGPFSTLVHLGNGTLCLLWSSFDSEEYTCVNCTKFGVSTEYSDIMGSYIVQATVKSFKVYRVPGCAFLKGSITVDAGEMTDHGKIENEEEPAKDGGELP